jgi:hypothetical protein
MDGIRKLVSGKRRRYVEDGQSLDLTYITDRIIAMSYPSSGFESMYRNPIEKVTKVFLKLFSGLCVFEWKASRSLLDNQY